MKQNDIKKIIGNKIKGMIVTEGSNLTKTNELINQREGTNHTVHNLQGKLSRGTISHAEVIQIADIIGYKIEWVKK